MEVSLAAEIVIRVVAVLIMPTAAVLLMDN